MTGMTSATYSEPRPPPVQPVVHRSYRDKQIAYADHRLTAWGSWARRDMERLGYPRLSLIYKVLKRRAQRGARPEGTQLTARGSETRSLRPRTVGEMPPSIREVDCAVAKCGIEDREFLKGEYLWHRDLSIELRARLAGCRVAEYRSHLRDLQFVIAQRLDAFV